MSYSMCRFWAYDESKKIIGAAGKDAPAWKLAVAGSMGAYNLFDNYSLDGCTQFGIM